MVENQDAKIHLELELSPHQPELLAGLDQWLNLGLISDTQVRALCQEQLSCQLPPVADPTPAQPATAGGVTDFLPYTEHPTPAANAASVLTEPSATQPSNLDLARDVVQDGEASKAAPRPVSPWLNRLLSELSVVWLLGLGVFLVVLSSAVLAATQWANFNAVGQYLVLLAYTLVFWGMGLWSSQNSRLRLTSQTLQMMTLLLVPLNFWAMDGLSVWAAGGGFVVAGIAAIGLTLATLQVMGKQHTPWLKQFNALGLAYLHTGWGVPGLTQWAVYAGVLASAAVTLVSHDFGRTGMAINSALPEAAQGELAAVDSASEDWSPTASSAARSSVENRPPSSQRWASLGVFFALGLLLLRALSVLPGNIWGQLGLAFGLYGATWIWLGPRSQAGDSTAARIPTRGSVWLGRGLLWWGWLIAIEDFRFQAFGVSVLGLGLRLQALQQWGRRRDLLVSYGIAVQLAFVGWQLIPSGGRGAIMTPLSAWATTRGGADFALLGLSLFPYVVGMVALADWYLRRGRNQLGKFSDGIALGSNLLLTIISLFSHPVLVVHLMAATITALIGTWRRSPARQWRIYLSQGLTLVTILVTLDYLWPHLSTTRWMVVVVALAVLWLGCSKVLPVPWGKSAGLYGFGLSGVAYGLLWHHLAENNFQSALSWLGLLIPLTLTLIGRYRASLLATSLALPLTLGLSWTRLVGLGTATSLTAANGTLYRRPWVAFAAIGLGLGFVVCGFEDLVSNYPATSADWCVVFVGLIAVLWIAERWLPPASSSVSTMGLYGRAADTWGQLLTVGVLGVTSISLGWLYGGLGDLQTPFLGAQLGLLALLALRYWGRVQSPAIYLSGWAMELLVAQVLAWRNPAAVSLAVPTLALGAFALALSSALHHYRSQLASPLQTLAVAYALLGLGLRSTTANAWTGWIVVGAALLLLEVGRRRQTSPMRWFAFLLLSVGWYELVVYQLLQTEGDFSVDGVIVLAGVAALIMAVYRLAATHLERHLRLPEADLIWAAHAHWLGGSLMMLGAGLSLRLSDPPLEKLGLVVAAMFCLYAFLQGRLGENPDLKQAWVYAGLIQLVGWVTLLRFAFSPLQRLDPWWGAVACAVAVSIYWVPWSRRGWPQRPWRLMAVIVPPVITLVTQNLDHIPTLWILAGFYGWLTQQSHRIRVSYLSAGCIVWAIWVWLGRQNIDDSLAFVLPTGLALIYIAQVDPDLREPDGKRLRHWLRLGAVGLILLTALASNRWTGLPVGMMGLAAIAAGLFFRIRAFLYTGTVVFVLNALNQLILLNATYPLIKWIVGILVGVALIWTAADFERRRDQWLMLTQNWMQDLDGWQ